jgi:ribonucleotide reductase beta subunit family protein with ferritin-like domain
MALVGGCKYCVNTTDLCVNAADIVVAVGCFDCKQTLDICAGCIEQRRKRCMQCKNLAIEKRLDNSQSLAFLPILNPGIEAMYQKLKRTRWTVADINFGDDRNHWLSLDENTKAYVKFILFLFAQLDGLVVENLVENFKEETVKLAKECKAFYAEQESNETTHNETYSYLIKAFISDPEEQRRGLDSINNYPAIRKIARWSYVWMDRDIPLSKRAIAFCCIEGVIFSSAFAGIYWIKRKNLLHGLTKANEWIARDEAVHTEFGVMIYHLLTTVWKTFPLLTTEEVHSIIRSAVEVTIEFTRDAMNGYLVGIDTDEMIEYVKCTADRLSTALGYAPLYDAVNPFDWMKIIALPNKSNFFETAVSEYSTSVICDSVWDDDF